MKLIKVSNNVLINPEKVASVEKRTISRKSVFIVIVENKSYSIEVPIEEFLRELKESGADRYEQFFAV